MGTGPSTHVGRGLWRRFLLVAVLLIALTGLTAMPAAAATCFQYGCTGKNPSTYGCSATWTPREMFLHSGRYTLQLRYSAGCYAFWGRIVRDDCSLIQGFAWLRVERQIASPYGWGLANRYYRIQSSIPCNGGVGWTYMVPNSTGADDRFRSCHSGYITAGPASSIPESQWTCTSWLVF